MSESTPTGFDGEALAARFEFLNRAVRADASKGMGAHSQPIEELRVLLDDDLLALARRGSPNDFFDIHASLVGEFERLSAFYRLPVLGRRWVVGFGGAFSAGKSSLINALLGTKLLPVEIDPTTSLPTYVLQGTQDAIVALNLRGRSIALTNEEFLSLNHDEMRLHGSEIAGLLRSAYVMREAFPWHGLAFADTPGYSKSDGLDDTESESTDGNIARVQLNAAHSVVWVVNAEDGGIKESDLRFLTTLRTDIPRLVVVARADKKTPDEIHAIVAGIRRTLKERNLAVLDVIPVSRRSSAGYPMQPLLAYFSAWDTVTPPLSFPSRFKLALRRYWRFLEQERVRTQAYTAATNRSLAVLRTGDEGIEVLGPLNRQAKADVERFASMQETLLQLERQMFLRLERIGDVLGIEMREPTEIELLGEKRYALVGQLSGMLARKREGAERTASSTRVRPANRHEAIWSVLNEVPNVCDVSVLLRRHARRYRSRLDLLRTEVCGDSMLLHRSAQRYTTYLEPLRQVEDR